MPKYLFHLILILLAPEVLSAGGNARFVEKFTGPRLPAGAAAQNLFHQELDLNPSTFLGSEFRLDSGKLPQPELNAKTKKKTAKAESFTESVSGLEEAASAVESKNLSKGPSSLERDFAASNRVFSGAKDEVDSVAVLAEPVKVSLLRRSEKQVLLDRLSRSLNLEKHGKGLEREALRSSISRLLDSPTALGLAKRFVATETKVSVSFDPMPDHMAGSHFKDGRQQPKISIAERYLDAPQDNGEIIFTLVHELLGHGLEAIQATTIGMLDAFLIYRENEINARLVEWIVRAELGYGPGKEAKVFLKSPSEFHNKLRFLGGAYALSLSLTEMKKDVYFIYRRRLMEIENKLLASSPLKWRRSWQSRRIRYAGPLSSTQEIALPEIRDRLYNAIRYLQSKEGHYLIGKLQWAARHPYFRGLEKTVERLMIRFESLVKTSPKNAQAELRQ